MEKTRVGFALCGSFCTFAKVLPEIQRLVDNGFDVIPIMSQIAYSTDTRFGRAEDFIKQIEDITGHHPLHTIPEVEPIGPKKLLDVLVIAPCTGNTLSKIAHGISDSSVSLAAKSHMRNERPVVIAVSSNDALASNAKNLGELLAQRHMYFVPMRQDDPKGKPRSIVADMVSISPTVIEALQGKQIQPIFI